MTNICINGYFTTAKKPEKGNNSSKAAWQSQKNKSQGQRLTDQYSKGVWRWAHAGCCWSDNVFMESTSVTSPGPGEYRSGGTTALPGLDH